MTPITKELKHEIARDLEQYHCVFETFWELSSIYFVDEKHAVKTAAVCFPKSGGCQMLINNEFWDGLNDDEQHFVILHECMHVLLDHGIRNGRYYPGATHELVNIAQDITINEMITDLFKFVRTTLRGWERFCWIDTCFKDPTSIERNQTFMYYLKELIKNGVNPGVKVFDSHGYGDDNGEDPEYGGVGGAGDPDKMAEELGRVLSDAELEYMLDKMGHDDSKTDKRRGLGLSPFRVLLKQREVPSMNFDQLVQGLKRSALAKRREFDTFAVENRRLGGVSSRIMLPGRREDRPDPHKLITLVFFDVSGSCMPYLEKLNSIRLAFEKEKNLFDVRSYAFDTVVHEVKPGQPLSVGGGTSFDIVEDECQRVMKQDGRYPDCVVMITDGYGNEVLPEYPARWVWLLTPDGSKDLVPIRSRSFPIKSVVF